MSLLWKRRMRMRSTSSGSRCRTRSTRSRASTTIRSMSAPSSNSTLTLPLSARAVAVRVVIPGMVPMLASSGRTMRRSVSSGDEDSYWTLTQRLFEPNDGRNSRGSRVSEM